MANAVDATVEGEALNSFGFTAYDTIEGLGLNSFGFLWPCSGIWAPDCTVSATLTTWTGASCMFSRCPE